MGSGRLCPRSRKIDVHKSVKTTAPRPITTAEIQQAFEPLVEKYPPILFLQQAAEISGYTTSTLKKKLSEGCFRDCVARGKPLLFWRDRFILELMNSRVKSRHRSRLPDLKTAQSEVQS